MAENTFDNIHREPRETLRLFTPEVQERLAAAIRQMREAEVNDPAACLHNPRIIAFRDRSVPDGSVLPPPRDPILQDMSDAELLWTFRGSWFDAQNLLLEGALDYNPEMTGIESVLEHQRVLTVCADKVAALVRELVNRFPPAKGYSHFQYVSQLAVLMLPRGHKETA